MATLLSPGALIEGRYELEALLGEGTFGEVWRAHDTKLAARPVAVKLLKAELLAYREVVDRFDGEAAALVQLTHPNVVQIFDRGEYDGTRYLVMALVEGKPLEDWLEEHRQAKKLPGLDAVRDIFDQVCAGVEAVHDLRAPEAIIHRDLKPGNVMLVQGEKNRRVAKVLDFGMARLGMRHGTESGFVMGTPA